MKAQYDLERQTAKISTLTSESVSKYEFLIVKVVLPEERIIRKGCYNHKLSTFTIS